LERKPLDPLIAVRQLIAAGRRDEAEQHCVALLAKGPVGVPLLLLLGALQLDRGAPALAVDTLKRALSIEPASAGAMLQLAVAQFRNRDFAAARSTLEGLLAREPGNAIAAFHLALLLDQAGDPVGAERHYRVALTSKPDYVEAKLHFGFLLLRLARSADALPFLSGAWNPAQPRGDLALAIARAQLDLGAFAEAVEFARHATSLLPSTAMAWLILGTALRRAGNPLAAQQALEKSLALSPENVIALAEIGCNELSLGDYSNGLKQLEHACRIAPDWSVLRWLDALALPVLPDDDRMVQEAMLRFRTRIDALIADLDRDMPVISDGALGGLERAQPFLLHYLPADTTALTFRYGELVESAMRHCIDGELFAPIGWRPLDHGGRLRVGFVSCEFRLHTVTRYFSEWLMRLDRDRFEIHAWHLGEVADELTRRIAAQVQVLRHAPHASTAELSVAIRSQQLDVLIYLEVGMDSRPQMLASQRLAPVQCVAYGHPATSGLHNVDWFLSGDALEPADARRHYREKLEKLPGLGVVPTRPPAPGSGDWLPREPGRPLLMCLQSLFKLTPDFDHAVARIAGEADARILFFEFPNHCVERFRQRLTHAFEARGLDIDRHVELIGRRDYPGYLGGIAGADLVLDSIGFSGGATSLDALSVGTPVITVEGQFMRGRQTAAMLRLLGVDELIGRDIDSYVKAAVSLSRDADRRESLRARLLQASDRLFEPVDVMPALAEFLQREARSAAESVRDIKGGY
jgi:protein O-GlcNAc transferase